MINEIDDENSRKITNVAAEREIAIEQVKHDRSLLREIMNISNVPQDSSERDLMVKKFERDLQADPKLVFRVADQIEEQPELYEYMQRTGMKKVTLEDISSSFPTLIGNIVFTQLFHEGNVQELLALTPRLSSRIEADVVREQRRQRREGTLGPDLPMFAKVLKYLIQDASSENEAVVEESLTMYRRIATAIDEEGLFDFEIPYTERQALKQIGSNLNVSLRALKGENISPVPTDPRAREARGRKGAINRTLFIGKIAGVLLENKKLGPQYAQLYQDTGYDQFLKNPTSGPEMARMKIIGVARQLPYVEMDGGDFAGKFDISETQNPGE